MCPSHLITVKDPNEEEENQNIERNFLLETPIMQRKQKRISIIKTWVKKAVDQGSIMSYKAICDNCSGNGHINITNSKGITEPKQCWMCESNGEIKYEEDFINKLITNYHHRVQ